MIHDQKIIHIIWIFIFIVIHVMFCSLAIRFVFHYMIKQNVCNLQTILSNTRILQTSKEKKLCNALDVSLQKTFHESNIQRLFPVLPQFMVSPRTSSEANNSSHLPLFQIAVDGKILNPELLIATSVPDYSSVVGNQNVAAENNMLADYYRNNMQPLDGNSSLNRLSTGNYGSYGHYSEEPRVPVDRPLYINTSMSAQQRVDIYRQLSDPPKDSEPALAFHFRNL